MHNLFTFHTQYPTLDRRLFFDLREHTPAVWLMALDDGSAMPTANQCLPTVLHDLLDLKGPHQQYALKYACTLIQRTVAPLCKLKMSHIYAAMMAEQFQLPRTVNPNATLARHLHLFSSISER